jgi:hypothetical protein
VGLGFGSRLRARSAKKNAGKPYWLPDSRVYGGDFYRFAVAIWQCLRDWLPEVRNALPKTEQALAEELRDHWPKERVEAGKRRS